MALPIVSAPDELRGKELIAATKPFASESVAMSWWSLVSTYLVLFAFVAVSAAAPLPWPLRLLVSVFEGLVVVRAFILYHDHMHGALLKDSKVGSALIQLAGYFVMAPPNTWRQSHNYHHAHNAQIVGSHVGSFALLTTGLYAQATPAQRRVYRIIRHPLTILFGILTLFLWGMCLSPLLREPRKNGVESVLSLALHGLLAALFIHYLGVAAWLFAVLLPLSVGCCVGGYLFYAQHNFPGMHVEPRQTWDYTRAALESSSYMRCGPILNWLTGNIGYHHVHHLNPFIPFYRLPEVMHALPELQHPGTTSLSPRDIFASFQLKLWDPALGHMVGYPKR